MDVVWGSRTRDAAPPRAGLPVAGLSFGKWLPIPKDRRVPVLISGRQQFVVPAISYQRRIVQSRRGGNTVGVCRLHDCVVGVAGVPVGSRSRHLFILTQEFAS